MHIFLETERLILKAPQWSDLEDLIALRSDPKVMQFIGSSTGIGKPQTKEQVERFLKIAIDYQTKHGFGFCSVFKKDSGKFIGQAGLFHLGFDEEQSEIEIAYRLHQKYWSMGYATELAKALIYWGFTHLPYPKLVAICFPDNKRSQHVLEKAGMRRTGNTMYHNIEVQYYEIYKDDAIALVEYNNQWPAMAQHEIAFIRKILPAQHILDIQHVGSTAIPGMIAKPIIDIQIAVDSLPAIKQLTIDTLQEHGYVYWAENPDPDRLFFVKGMPPHGKRRTHHIHIYEPSSRHWREKILFRDYLIAHPEQALQYAKIKKELAKKHTHDREQYTEAKTEFVQAILAKAKSAKNE